VSHIDQWNEKSETLIIFDWDDTICPTSYGKHHSHAERRELWEDHERAVLELLRVAKRLGHVSIVTMAKAEWIEESLAMYLPNLISLLEECGAEVIEARSSLSQHGRHDAFADCRNPSQFAKTHAMERVIRKFYRRDDGMRSRKSWKNILSIGDSTAERLALQDVVFRHRQCDRFGRSKDCRCKTVQLLESPTLRQLTAELQVIVQWLPTLLYHDGDLDLDFASEDLVPRDDGSTRAHCFYSSECPSEHGEETAAR
jgi:hypothetical protein